MIRIIYEGTRYDKQAAKIISDSGLFDEETANNIIQALFREDIHAFVHSPNWLEKYLKGIVRMMLEYSNGDRDKALEFLNECPPVFDRYLTWVKQNREKVGNSLDTEFVQKMSYQDVKDKLEEIQTELDKQSQDELSKMDFSGSSNYELIPIESYSEFHKLFGGSATGDGSSDKDSSAGDTAWCYANSETVYDQYSKNGQKQCFVLANKNWKNIPFDKESNSNNPKDDYGNSLICIWVISSNGRLSNATLRCNHVGISTNVDNQYKTYAELSKVVGFNVEEKVKDYLEQKGTLIDLSKINVSNLWKSFDGSGESLDKILNSLGLDREDLTEVSIPDTVTKLGEEVFADCASLTSIEIPNSVTSIGDSAFSYCESLTSVTIGNGVTSIDDSAFSHCPVIIETSNPYVIEYCIENDIRYK